MKITKAEIDSVADIWATYFDTGEIKIGSSELEVSALIKPDGQWEERTHWELQTELDQMELDWDEAGNKRTPMSTEDRKRYAKMLDELYLINDD